LINLIKKNSFKSLTLLTYLSLLFLNREMAFKSIKNSTYYLIEMLQILPVIFLLIVAIEVLIPKKWIVKNLGNNSSFKGSLLALLFGSISAGPIYAAFPIVKMLHSKGASIKNIVIILSSWAVVKIPMLANEVKFLGPKFMLTRWILTVIAILAMATIMDKMTFKISYANKKSSKLEVKSDYCIACGKCYRQAPQFFKSINKKAILVDENIQIDNENDKKLLTEIAKSCPSQAITYNI